MKIDNLEKLLTILISREDLRWIEYKQIRTNPGKYFSGIKCKKEQVTLLRTICPRTLIKIEFRFILAGNSGLTAYIYELRLIDELQQFEKKDLIKVVKRKGQPGVEMLEVSFDAIRKDALLLQKKKKVVSEEETIKLMQRC